MYLVKYKISEISNKTKKKNLYIYRQRCKNEHALRGFSSPSYNAYPILGVSCRQKHWRWTFHQDEKRFRVPSCHVREVKKGIHRHQYPKREWSYLENRTQGRDLRGLLYYPLLLLHWSMLLHFLVPMRYIQRRGHGLLVRPLLRKCRNVFLLGKIIYKQGMLL